MNLLSVSLNHLQSTFFSQNNYNYLLSASQFLFEFTIFLANSPWIHLFPQNHNKFNICFAISLWIHYLFSRSHYENTFFREINMNSLSTSRIYLESFFYWKITTNLLFASPFLLQFTIFFCGITMNSLWNHYETIMKSLWNRNYYEFAMKSVWNHYETHIMTYLPFTWWLRYDYVIEKW